jgi:hypothetical protein
VDKATSSRNRFGTCALFDSFQTVRASGFSSKACFQKQERLCFKVPTLVKNAKKNTENAFVFSIGVFYLGNIGI